MEDNAHVFLKLSVMLYADDTVILAERADDLQNALIIYALYCVIWKLTINSGKQNVLFLLEVCCLTIISDSTRMKLK